MKLKSSHVLLGSILPGAVFVLGLSVIHRAFTTQSIQNEEIVSSLSGSSPGLIVAVAPQQVAMSSTPHKTSVPIESSIPSNSWRFFDPHSMKGDDRVWLNTEVLFFQPHIGSLSYGTESKSTTTIRDGEVKSPHFDWSAGYRAGIGYKIPHDHWDLFANYTYLQGSAHGSAGDNDHVVFPIWATHFGSTPADPFYAASATAHWNMHLNMGDLELGRNCFAGKWVSIRPFLGVRGMTINQDYHVKYKGGTVAPLDTDNLHLNTDFWGVGVRMGFNSLWGVGRGFSLYGNGSASLLSGHFDVHEREKLINAHLKKMNIESRVNNVVVDADVSLGVQWDYMFSRDRYHFGVKMGWEFDMFFNQNQLFNFSGTNPGALRCQHDDLSFQGVTLGFRFDF